MSNKEYFEYLNIYYENKKKLLTNEKKYDIIIIESKGKHKKLFSKK